MLGLQRFWVVPTSLLHWRGRGVKSECRKWWNEIKQLSSKSSCQRNVKSYHLHHDSPSPSFSRFMKGLSFFSNKTAVSVWFLLNACHVISSRIICTRACKIQSVLDKSISFQFAYIYQHIFAIMTLPEASPEPSSRQRRSRGCGHVLLEPEPVRLIYVEQLPSGSQSLCSPGCPLRLPVLLDDA